MERKRDTIASARDSQRGNRGKEKVDEAESQELEPSFADLPSAITTHILLQLPIKSVIICKCVCRTWKALISDPLFAKLHFERAPVSVMIRTNDRDEVSRTLHLLEYEPEKFERRWKKLETRFKLPLCDAKLVLKKRDKAERNIARNPENHKYRVVNSCNGLLCLLAPWKEEPLVVCNPVTGEFIRLPEATRVEKTLGPLFAGFGFQPKTNEYKVIRMWKRYVRSLTYACEWVVVEMHTLGTPTWRNVRVDNQIWLGGLGLPTCLNGALHWINFHGLTSIRSILCFNLESERFQPFPFPPVAFENNGTHDRHSINLGELRGFLYICYASFLDSVMMMWVMKKYGIGESWTKVCSIDILGQPTWPYGLFWPVEHFKKRAVVLMYNSKNRFTYYEPEKHGFKIFQVNWIQSRSFEVIPHIPSLISLKDALKGDNIEVLNVHSRCAKFKLHEEEVFFLGRDYSDEEYTS